MNTPVLQPPFVTPSERLAQQRQVDLLVALADLGGTERSPVPAKNLASRLDITPKTVSRVAAFLVHGGLLQPGRGAWALTELGYSLARLQSTDAARGQLLLRDRWESGWFHQRALQFLAHGPAEAEDLANCLVSGLSATPQSGMSLVEWMAYALLIDRDEQGQIVVPAWRHAGDQPPSAPHSAPPNMPGALTPFLSMSPEAFSALPRTEFVALLQAYESIFVKLASDGQKSSS